MKKALVCFIAFTFLNYGFALASCHCGCAHSNCSHSHSHNGHYSHSSSSSGNNVYLINKDYRIEKEAFQNCDKHYMTVETTTYYYSDGSRRVYNNYTIYNSDGTLLIENCQDAKHFIYDKNHYFIVRKKGCYLLDSKGEKITQNTYSKMEEIAPNRLLVKLNKKYGIIDLKENIIADIKYKSFKKVLNDIYITKLNGYFGLMNSKGEILIKNDCEKIKPIQNAILIKRYNKYGLMNSKGEITAKIEQDKIKRLEEYIIVEKDKNKKVYDSKGTIIDLTPYKDIKLERNTLFGYTKEGKKEVINNI